MHYKRLLCILQCTAGLSGTVTFWNVLNSSAVGTFNEPATTGATLSNVKLVWLTCCFAVMSIFGLLSLSKRGVIAFSGFMLSARLKIFLHAFRLFERCLQLRSTTGRAQSLCRHTLLPYEIRVPALHDLRRLHGSFSLACESSYAPLPSAPPTGGVPGTMTTTTFLLTENR